MAEQSGGNLERRVSVLEAARKELEDAMLVHAVLESKAAQRIKEHAEFIAKHDQFLARHEVWAQEMDEKIAFLLNREMRRDGGPEAK